MATFNETCAPTSRKYVSEPGMKILCNVLVAILLFFFKKQPKKLNFQSFFNSKRIIGGCFQWNVCTQFQKVRIWTYHQQSKFAGETTLILVVLFRFCFGKATSKSKFSIFKRIVGGYFQGNMCTYSQKICVRTRHDHCKFIRHISIFFVAVLRFYFRKKT